MTLTVAGGCSGVGRAGVAIHVAAASVGELQRPVRVRKHLLMQLILREVEHHVEVAATATTSSSQQHQCALACQLLHWLRMLAACDQAQIAATRRSLAFSHDGGGGGAESLDALEVVDDTVLLAARVGSARGARALIAAVCWREALARAVPLLQRDLRMGTRRKRQSRLRDEFPENERGRRAWLAAIDTPGNNSRAETSPWSGWPRPSTDP